jgi:DNA ligase-4
MGEDSKAMAYDEDHIFKHLCAEGFFLRHDSPEDCSDAFTLTHQATAVRMAWLSLRNMRASWRKGHIVVLLYEFSYSRLFTRLADIGKLITDNGGQLGTLDDPKLTHVVLDKRDDSRRRELMQTTAK